MNFRLPHRPAAHVPVVGVLACVLMLVLAAGCGDASSAQSAPGGPAAKPTSASPTPSPVPTDKPGGTLRLLTAAMPNGDPGWADSPAERALLRLVSRQLYDYPTSPDPDVVRRPRPDLAVAMPLVSEDGTEYTVQLRGSARWDSHGVRRVTSTDVVRGIERLCAPPDPSPYRGYFAATVVGFADYCTQLAAVPADAVADFVEGNDVEGLEVVGDDTVTFHLLAPSADFTEVLALPAATPVPLEALAHPPDSPDYLDNLIALGPYRFAGTDRDGSYRLARNPVWSASSDRIRPALPDHVTIRAESDAEAVQADLEGGRADMAIGVAVPAARADVLAGQFDARLSADGPGTTVLLVVGLGGPAGAALREDQARRALPYCVNRAEVVAALGGPVRAHSATQFLQPGMMGYTPLDPFPTAGGAGDPERCRAGLDAATGGPVTELVLLTSDTPVDRVTAEVLHAAFARAGIRLDVRELPEADFARATTTAVPPAAPGTSTTPATPTAPATGGASGTGGAGGAGGWDLALATITPDWFGDAGMTVYAPLVDGTWAGPRPPDGGYRSEAASTLLQEAMAATDETAAVAGWERLETEVLGDAAAIPLAVALTPRFHGANVLGFVTVPTLGGGDPTAVSLDLP